MKTAISPRYEHTYLGFPGGSVVKTLLANAGNAGDTVGALGQDSPLQKEMATHSSILAYKISLDRGAWWATVHGVTNSRTQLSD